MLDDMNWIHVTQEQINEPSGSVKCREFRY
jgi:hypothetical protein